MQNELTVHFNMLDYYKNLLFNATTEEQEERARKIIAYEKEQENHLYIKKELSYHNPNVR